VTKFIDITGQKFGMLTAVKFIEIKFRTSIWLFKCDCGVEKKIYSSNVKSGNTKSCGCLHTIKPFKILTQDILKTILNYNPETGIFTWKKTLSNVAPVGSIAGTRGKEWGIKINKKKYLSHRLAYLYVYGNIPSNMEIDHINKNPFDNRIVNIRLATRSQNMFNTGKRISNTSGFKGVYWDKSRGNFVALITFNYKLIYLGRFKTAIEAHTAYCEKAKEMHGEFARFE